MHPHIPEIFKLPLAVPFWIVFLLVFVREGRIIRQAIPDASSSQDAGTFRLLVIGTPLAMLAATATSFVPWMTLPFPALCVGLGMIMLVAGGVLRRYCFRALGKYFTGSVLVSEGQRVVQHGVYRLVRHPAYTAAFLMFTGIGIALGSWLSLGILFFVHCFLYGARVAAEERALLKTIGEPYREYMSRTKRFIPYII